jgi:lia operon protein LiaG
MRIAIAGLLSLMWPALLSAQQVERFILAGDEVGIYNLAGQVRVEPSQRQVVIEMTRGGRDASQLRVERGELDGRETLRVIYPADQIVYSPTGPGGNSSTQLRVHDDGTFGDDEHGRHHHERGRRVSIKGSGSGLEAHADLKIRVPKGQRVCVYLAVGAVSVTNVEGELHVDAHSASITATGIRGDMNLDVGSGSVRVTGAEGDLNVDTGSGPVEVARFQGGHLLIDTGSGEVTGSELRSKQLSIDTGSGDIQLTGVSASSLALETGSGSVTADLREDFQSLDVETGSGDVAIKAPPTLSAEIQIETSNGDIESDFPMQLTERSPDHVVGRIGDGRGKLAIETGSGGIRLLKSSN